MWRQRQSATVGIIKRQRGYQLIVLVVRFRGDQTQSQISLLKIVTVFVFVCGRYNGDARIERFEYIGCVLVERIVGKLG